MNGPDRKLTSWINGFLEHTKEVPSPLLFRRWCAISAIAGALERKVWVITQGEAYYPNLYIFLAGGAGVGKTAPLKRVTRLWTELKDHHVSATSVTAAALIDELNDAKRKLVRPTEFPPFIEFNSLLVPINELSVFLPEYGNEFMGFLTDIWDNLPFKQRRRTKDLKIEIRKPQLNILAATTPAYLNNVLPPQAWEEGFMARTIVLYSNEVIKTDPFISVMENDPLYEELIHDLKIIGDLVGEITFTAEAVDAIRKWHFDPHKPTPSHPKLMGYVQRRISQVLKLVMIAAVDVGHVQVTLEDFQRVLGWLTEAEAYMPDIFRAMNVGGDARAIEECWYFVYTEQMRKNKSVLETRVIAFLAERIPAHSVLRVLEVMVKAQVILQDQPPGQLVMQYKAGEKRYG